MNTVFPQANNMDMIFRILNEFDPSGEQKTSISSKELLHEREGDYYLSALVFIGFAEKRGQYYYLTDKGLTVYQTENPLQKIIKFAEMFFSNPILSDMYNKGLNFSPGQERKEFYAKYIHMNYGLLESTSERRASTINSWFLWFEERIND